MKVPILHENYNHMVPFEFEKYDYIKWEVIWFKKYYFLSILACVLYLVLIYWGKKWMETRPPFKLQGLLAVWNIGWCLFSIAGFSRTYPELNHEIKKHGVYFTLCDNSERTIIMSFWGTAYVVSKIFQFGDTAFIILRKQELTLLNWYHHLTVVIYVFYVSAGDFDPSNRLFASINYSLHALLYGYFALKALKIHVPQIIGTAITLLQLVEMFAGVILNVYSFAGKVSGHSCERPYQNFVLAFVMYASFFYLFVELYKNSNKKKLKKVD